MPGIIVLGGAGFIGSNIVDELMIQGHEVTVFDNFSEGKMENLVRWKGHKRLDVIRGDIRDFDTLKRLMDHKEWVFHLAAMSRIQPSITDPLLAFDENCMGTAKVLEACRLNGVKRFVYSASSSAYGDGLAKLGSFGTRGLNEESPSDCGSPYALSKKFGEEACELYRKLYGLSTISLRYFNVYGPRHQETGSYATVIAIFRKQKREGMKLTVVGDGEQRRDFTFVSDIVRANMLAAMNRDTSGTINIGTGKNYSINQIAEKIGGEVEFIPPRLGEYRATLADNNKAKNVLGWKPMVDIDAGLEITDEYEKANSGRLIILG